MKRTISKLLGFAALAIAGISGSFIATPALAVTTVTSIECSTYLPNTNNYPRDQAGHAQLCRRKVVVDGGTATYTSPTTSRANTLFGAVSGAYAVNKSLPVGVKNQLIAKNVKYFFFNNRADADIYFSLVAPYNSATSVQHSFLGGPGGARCANTGYGISGGALLIAVAIYDNCNYDHLPTPKVVVNPALEKTILHETGHAFDFTFGTPGAPGNIPSNRSGWIDLSNKDKDALTTPKPGVPPAVWSSLTVAQRDKLVCTLFAPNNNKPSELEQDLGATLHGGAQGQVCIAGSPNGIRYSYWVGATLAQDFNPQQIATLEKLPYFMTNKQELWAELFVTEIYGSYGTPNFLKFTDDVLHNDAIVSTPGYKRSFDCARNIVSTYTNTLLPPSQNATGCTTTGTL